MFIALKVPRGSITKSTFPLPQPLSEQLKQISHIVHKEHGFQVLRGLEPSRYSREDNIIAYVGITTHMAEKRTSMGKSLIVAYRDPGGMQTDRRQDKRTIVVKGAQRSACLGIC